MDCCVHIGEAAALFVQRWFTGEPLDKLFRIIVLDELNAQTPDLHPWFRETREAMFGCTLEEVRMRHSITLPCTPPVCYPLCDIYC